MKHVWRNYRCLSELIIQTISRFSCCKLPIHPIWEDQLCGHNLTSLLMKVISFLRSKTSDDQYAPAVLCLLMLNTCGHVLLTSLVKGYCEPQWPTSGVWTPKIDTMTQLCFSNLKGHMPECYIGLEKGQHVTWIFLNFDM